MTDTYRRKPDVLPIGSPGVIRPQQSNTALAATKTGHQLPSPTSTSVVEHKQKGTQSEGANRLLTHPCRPFDSILDAAIAYSRTGWHVVPMKPDRSRAYTKYKDRPLPSPDQVKWWFSKWPDALLTVKLPIDLVVLDLDPRDQSLDDLLRSLDNWCAPPDAPTVRTPKGGRHIWFKLPVGVVAPNWTSQHGKLPVDGIDVRGGRGLATLPPSRRTDGTYCWETCMEHIPDAPTELVELFKTRSQRLRPAGPLRVYRGDGLHPYVRKIVERTLHDLSSTKAGARNHTLFRAAATLSSLYAAGFVPAQCSRALLHCCEVNGLIADDGLRPVEATLRSGWETGLSCPRRLPEGVW